MKIMNSKTKKAIYSSYIINITFELLVIGTLWIIISDIECEMGCFMLIPTVLATIPVSIIYLFILKFATIKMIQNIQKGKHQIYNAFYFIWDINKWLVWIYIIGLLIITTNYLGGISYKMLVFAVSFSFILFVSISVISTFTIGLITVFIVEEILKNDKKTIY